MMLAVLIIGVIMIGAAGGLMCAAVQYGERRLAMWSAVVLAVGLVPFIIGLIQIQDDYAQYQEHVTCVYSG
jgi:hypothetical protein